MKKSRLKKHAERPIKIVLTGGPSGGKTTVAQSILREYAKKVVIVPEAASILFGGGWPRRKNASGVRFQQKAIYYVQREVEQLIETENHGHFLICDRGSLDGMAYWPKATGSETFLEAVESNLKTEIARYDYIIHLDTAPRSAYDLSNPLRNETFEEAWALNEKIKKVWSVHPHLLVIPGNEFAFMEKLTHALSVVEKILAGQTYAEIRATF
jgi:thymidylate kinase